MTAVSNAAISFRVSFLRTVAKLMLPSDLDVFEGICGRLNYGNATLDDIKKLEALENKFSQTGDDD
jgi:hypothetical protein